VCSKLSIRSLLHSSVQKLHYSFIVLYSYCSCSAQPISGSMVHNTDPGLPFANHSASCVPTVNSSKQIS